MKPIVKLFLLPIALVISNSLYSQVGINTVTPDPSAALDVFSNTKGLLIPRLTTAERDNIVLPATGLMIYNTSMNDGQLNNGTPESPLWIGIKGQDGPMITSATEGGSVSSTSTVDVLVPGMNISPAAGQYLVLFNGQMSSSNTQSFSSAQAIIDVRDLYDQLIAQPGGVAHGLIFGNGEILLPGVYDVGGAMSITGTLTLDGQGDANSIFIIRASGAFSTEAASSLILTGNAKPENIFWVTDGAASTGANSTLSGTVIHGSAAAGAVSLGASSTLDGRLFTTLGAASLGALAVLTAPTAVGPFSLGVLSTFAMWTSAGAISSAAGSRIIGDAGTGEGATTGMAGEIDGEIYEPNTTGNTIRPTFTSFSIYQNGTEVPNSSRTITVKSSVVSLQSAITTSAGDIIEVKWKVDEGTANIENRILSLVRSSY